MNPFYSSAVGSLSRRVRGCPSGMYIRSLIQRSEGPFHVRNHWGSSGVLARGFSSDGSLEIAASFCAALAPFE